MVERFDNEDIGVSDEEPGELVLTLRQASRLYRQRTDALETAASDLLGVNRTDLRCMDILLQRTSISAGELALAAGLSTGAVTAALDRLERAGYARRSCDPSDRRRVLVALTQSAIDRTEWVYGPLEESLIERFSEQHLAVITRFIEDAADIQLLRATQLRDQLERGGPWTT